MIGLTLLTHQVSALPSETETDLLAGCAHGLRRRQSILYVAVLAATALILLMAANTSYADFPRLAALAGR